MMMTINPVALFFGGDKRPHTHWGIWNESDRVFEELIFSIFANQFRCVCVCVTIDVSCVNAHQIGGVSEDFIICGWRHKVHRSPGESQFRIYYIVSYICECDGACCPPVYSQKYASRSWIFSDRGLFGLKDDLKCTSSRILKPRIGAGFCKSSFVWKYTAKSSMKWLLLMSLKLTMYFRFNYSVSFKWKLAFTRRANMEQSGDEQQLNMAKDREYGPHEYSTVCLYLFVCDIASRPRAFLCRKNDKSFRCQLLVLAVTANKNQP